MRYFGNELLFVNLQALQRKPVAEQVTPVQDINKIRNCEQCLVCGARVLRHQIGKHLVSHYHWRGMQRGVGRATSKSTAEALRRTADKMVLDHIHAIVVQAPFQCGVCRFYCNTSSAFREHWTSRMHLEKESEVRNVSRNKQYLHSGKEINIVSSWNEI